MTEPPSKQERESCWKARDVYWKCLDDANDDLVKCKIHRDLFEKDCSKIWVF
jgi:cytochrome c oxidase assembly factor 6